MPADITSRLRDFAEYVDDEPRATATRDAEMLRAAADEIERLRAELTWVAERMGGFCPGSWESGIATRVQKALGN